MITSFAAVRQRSVEQCDREVIFQSGHSLVLHRDVCQLQIQRRRAQVVLGGGGDDLKKGFKGKMFLENQITCLVKTRRLFPYSLSYLALSVRR